MTTKISQPNRAREAAISFNEDYCNEMSSLALNELIDVIQLEIDSAVAEQENKRDQALAEQRTEMEREKLASNIALLTLLVYNGKKGDMERIIAEFTENLASITDK